MTASNSTAYVQLLYSTILLQQGSSEDVNYWATLLDSGVLTAAQAETAFETSFDAVNFIDPVIRLYQGFFDRAPDPAGLSGWVNALRNGGLTLNQVAAGFAGSQEFSALYGTGANAVAFVTALYNNVLNRAPDSPGLAYWTSALNSGALTPAVVALDFTQSPENVADLLQPISDWFAASVANAQAGAADPYPPVLISSPGSPNNFVLTTGQDNFSGGTTGPNNFTGDLTPFSVNGIGPTLNAKDTIIGGQGVVNTLTVGDSSAAGSDIIPAGAVIQNIQNVALQTAGNAGGAAGVWDSSKISGVTNTTVISGGAGMDSVQASSASAIAVTHNNPAGGVVAFGGGPVTIVTSGAGAITVGAAGPSSPLDPAGTVTVTDNAATGGPITVFGGTSVTVTVASPTNLSAIAINTSLAAAISTSGGGATTIASGGGSITVGDIGGAVVAGSKPSGPVSVTETAATTPNFLNAGGTEGKSAILIDGGNGVTVSAQGQNIAIGAINGTAGAQMVTQSAVLTGSGLGAGYGAVIIDGGAANTVTTTGGDVTIGSAATGALFAPTGAVAIADRFSGYSATDAFAVLSGTTVSITDKGGTAGAIAVGAAATLNAAGTGLGNAAFDPTGNITIVNGGAGQWGAGVTKVYANGAATVSISGGAVAVVQDVEQTLATGGTGAVGANTLATVVLDGDMAAATAIDSNALASLTILDSQADAAVYAVKDNNAGHALTLTTGNDKSFTFADGTAGSLTIQDNGKAFVAGSNLTLVAPGATSLFFTEAGNLVLGGAAGLGGISTIRDLSAGNLTLGDLSGLTFLKSIDAVLASGAISATIDPGVAGFRGGPGNDTITITQNALGGEVTLAGGAGANTLVANYAAGSLTGVLENDVPLAFETGFTFQTLGLGRLAVSATAHTNGVYAPGDAYYDADGFSSLTLGAVAGPVTFENTGAGTGLAIAATPGSTVNYLLYNSAGANDTLPMTVGVDGAAQIGTANITATIATTAIENLKVASLGFVNGANLNTVVIGDLAARTLTITGDQNAALTLKTDALGALASPSSLISTVDASRSSGSIDVTGVAVGAAGGTFLGGGGRLTAAGVTGTDAPSVAEIDTIAISGSFATGDIVRSVVGGVTYTYTVLAGDTPVKVAAGLAVAITAPGVTTGYTAGNNFLTLTDNTKGVPLFSGVTATSAGAAATDMITTLYANNDATGAIDSFTTGSGGGTLTLGVGGGWNKLLATPDYDLGSEAVDLRASTGAVDIINVADGVFAARFGITGFQSVVGPNADILNFTTPKTVLGNFANPTAVTVAAAIGAPGIAAANILDPSTTLAGDLANLSYSVANGVVAFAATTGHMLSAFTISELIDAAELILDYSSGGGVNMIAAFASGGGAFVVTSDATAAVTAPADGSSVVQLAGMGSVSGFGTTGAATAILAEGVTNTTAGNSIANGTYNDAGFSHDSLTASGAGSTTTYNNLAPSAALDIGGGFGVHAGGVVVTQTGAAGSDSLTVNLADGTIVDSLTISDAYAVVTGSGAISSLVDAGKTLQTLALAGPGTLVLTGATSGTLTTIDGSAATGLVTIGAADAPLALTDVTIKPETTGEGTTIVAGGNIDAIVQSTGFADVTVAASGTAQLITLADGDDTIAASGYRATIHVGNGVDTIGASGADDAIVYGTGSTAIAGDLNGDAATGSGVTITAASTGGVQLGSDVFYVGANATVTLGSTAGYGGTTVVVTGDSTGGNSSGFAQTTIIGAVDGTTGGQRIVFNNVGGGESMTGSDGGVAGAQVNVASAASLAAALDLAARFVAPQGAGNALAANTGKLDWFQYGGNTWIVEAVNNSSVAGDHQGLGPADLVVELVGLVNLNGATFAAAAHTFTI